MLRIALLCVTMALASANLHAKWAVYKQVHGKSYGAEEDSIRKYIYQANLNMIQEHNEKYARGESTYYMGENKFTDMTNAEFRRKMNGMNVNVPEVLSTTFVDTSELPGEVDWRQKGIVTPVKDQGQCGSCWAFSTTGSLEGQHALANGKLVSLSESNLVDCSEKEGNMGCGGGLMDQGFQYVIDNNGIDTEQSYPYKPIDRSCHFNPNTVGATLKSYVDVPHGNEKALQRDVAKVGPISVAIDAGHASFQSYKGGIYDEPACSSTQLDHGVLAVGYGTENGKDYWLVKNSWGTVWGDQGYIKMTRNQNNQCGIASSASYPVV